jgi:hypothetical protein
VGVDGGIQIQYFLLYNKDLAYFMLRPNMLYVYLYRRHRCRNTELFRGVPIQTCFCSIKGPGGGYGSEIPLEMLVT